MYGSCRLIAELAENGEEGFLFALAGNGSQAMNGRIPWSRGVGSLNTRLASVPPEAFERWRIHLTSVELPLGHSVYEPGTQLSHVYFPLNCIGSLLPLMQSGASAVIALVGDEGVGGVSIFMGADSGPIRAVVQSAGTALSVP
jgi:hypothetical protein